jgi:hypothetical protein
MGQVMVRVLVLVVVACGGPAKEIEHAKSARYDAELPMLLAETEDVVRQWYRNVEVDQSSRTIRTSWQEIAPPRHNHDVYYDTRTTADRQATRTKYLVRFHITISGTRPSRIDVTGHAAKMVEGMNVPSELRREDEPGWTSELADKLRLKIHAKLERFVR